MTDDDTLDVSDLERHMGVPMEPGLLKEPVATNDIRRWVQAMHYPNPLHYDEHWAGASRFGELVAPQSFTVACDTSHGCSPAQVGRIPESHLVFGGDDWWFFGPRIRPGDHLICHRMPYDYRVTTTKFAGPTCFQRGDTLYVNQRGERVALQRSTAIRYKARQAREQRKDSDGADAPKAAPNGGEPTWTDEELERLEQRKWAFVDQVQALGHDPRPFESVAVGDRLAEHAMGPHSLASFATEWRAYPMTTWGATRKGPTSLSAEELGYTKEMAGLEGDRAMERVNPELTDGAYHGPSRGHLQPRWAAHIGMPRGYGYGASMGSWVLDYVAGWAGEWGLVVSSSAQYRNPALTGDATIINGTVTETRTDRRGRNLVTVGVDVTNQLDATLAKATVEVLLPTEEQVRNGAVRDGQDLGSVR